MSEPARTNQHQEHPGMPRWLKVSLLVAVAVILVLGVLALAGVGGSHGPGSH